MRLKIDSTRGVQFIDPLVTAKCAFFTIVPDPDCGVVIPDPLCLDYQNGTLAKEKSQPAKTDLLRKFYFKERPFVSGPLALMSATGAKVASWQAGVMLLKMIHS